MPARTDPIRETDEAARALAARLLREARTASLAVIDPSDGSPFVSRIAFGLAPDGTPLSLVSDLAAHARAMRADPRVSLLLGEPGAKGDPLTYPRLTVQARAEFVPAQAEVRGALRRAWIAVHPKAALYADFSDFHYLWLHPASAFLNAGFGKAYALSRNDLKLTKRLD
ncbi:MAG: pyridoxamine 5'-phosphate oxidase family protein [Rhodobacteraceae bacterium]|nr:pyridoxamine 5'-phosphate oxidase family protein [Paracoccaceae bacterium]